MVKEKSCIKEHYTIRKQAGKGILKPSAKQINAGDTELQRFQP